PTFREGRAFRDPTFTATALHHHYAAGNCAVNCSVLLGRVERRWETCNDDTFGACAHRRVNHRGVGVNVRMDNIDPGKFRCRVKRRQRGERTCCGMAAGWGAVDADLAVSISMPECPKLWGPER